MDPLSDVLSLLKLQSYLAGGLSAGGDWAIQFHKNRGIKCYAVATGQCWLAVDGVRDAMHLKQGDCFVLPSGRPFRLASDLNLTPIDATVAYARKRNGILSCNDGDDFFLVGSYFTLAGNHAAVLSGILPPIVRIRDESEKALLRWCVERMGQELREPQPGGALVAQQLTTMMLVQALRLHLADGASGGVGWLFALADKRMGAAITAMHEQTAHRWSLQSLAERAGMSRTAFAVKFKETVGKSPMDYLTHWRMRLAADRLSNSGDPVSLIAESLGYESDSAFSTAFKRIMGCSPREYGRGGHADDGQYSERKVVSAAVVV